MLEGRKSSDRVLSLACTARTSRMLKAIRGKSWSNPGTNNTETPNESATASVSDIGENESQLGSVSISSTSQTTQLDQDEDRDHQWVQYQKLTNDRLKAATSAYAVHLGE